MVRDSINTLYDKLGGEEFKYSLLSEDLGAYQFKNTGTGIEKFTLTHKHTMIHFFFSISGNILLDGKDIDQSNRLDTSKFVIFSYPIGDTKIDIELSPGAEIFSFIISMKALHEIFGSSFGSNRAQMKSFMDSYEMTQFFVERDFTPSLNVIIHQFFNGVRRENVQQIYQQGKIMEFLSMYMDTPKSVHEADDSCPYVIDAFEMDKIKKARDIIIERMMDPPSLKSLARQVGTNEFKLKVGFKSVFHNTVYGYLADYRMEQARKLLTVNNLLVKEVSTQVGYSNPSHFIAAYKRRFGVTPKQHIKSSFS